MTAMMNDQTNEESVDDVILQVFEDSEDDRVLYFPVSTQKQARLFVKALHAKGVSYKTICDEIRELEHNFTSWRTGIGRPGIGNRVIERINKPIQELFSAVADLDEQVAIMSISDSINRQSSHHDDASSTTKVSDAAASTTANSTVRDETKFSSRLPNSSVDDLQRSAHLEDVPKQLSGDEIGVVEKSPEISPTTIVNKSEEAKPSSTVDDKQLCDAVKPLSDVDDPFDELLVDTSVTAQDVQLSSEIESNRLDLSDQLIDVGVPSETTSDDNLIHQKSAQLVETVIQNSLLLVQRDSCKEEVLEKSNTCHSNNKPTNSAEHSEKIANDLIFERPSVGPETNVEEIKSIHCNGVNGTTTSNTDLYPSPPQVNNGTELTSHGDCTVASKLVEIVDENYNSDDEESKVRCPRNTSRVEGPGYVYVFTDTLPTNSSKGDEYRVKIGASRYPYSRLRQAAMFNVDIRLVSAVNVSARLAALRAVNDKVSTMAVPGTIDWFIGPLEAILDALMVASRQFTITVESEC